MTANGQSRNHGPTDDDLVEPNTTLDWILFSCNSFDCAILRMICRGLRHRAWQELADRAGIEGAPLISPAGDGPAEVAGAAEARQPVSLIAEESCIDRERRPGGPQL